jgi:hypothetical protein
MNFCRTFIGLVTVGLVLALPALARAEDPVKVLQRENEELRKLIEEQRALLKALADIQDLKARVLSLEQRMDTLPRETRRVSPSPPQTGTIRLENQLPDAATVIINDVAYRLAPFQTREIRSFPAGAFTFEVIVEGFGSLQPRAARTLLPNAVYRIFTQP